MELLLEWWWVTYLAFIFFGSVFLVDRYLKNGNFRHVFIFKQRSPQFINIARSINVLFLAYSLLINPEPVTNVFLNNDNLRGYLFMIPAILLSSLTLISLFFAGIIRLPFKIYNRITSQ
jgi:hypothetical protein